MAASGLSFIALMDGKKPENIAMNTANRMDISESQGGMREISPPPRSITLEFATSLFITMDNK